MEQTAICTLLLLALSCVRPAIAAAQLSPLVPSRQTSPVAGTEIRVTELTGERRVGRLVELSDREIVFKKDGREVRQSLADVQRIDRVAHHIRNGLLIGLAGGVGLALALCGDGDYFCIDASGRLAMAAMLGGAGAAVGAGAGALIDRSFAEQRVIYRRQNGPAVTFSIAPARAAIALRLQW